MTMARESIQMDRDKLRAEVRKLGNEYVFSMLDDAIELLPPAKLHKIARNYIDLKLLRPDVEQATRPSLLMDCYYSYGRGKMLAIARRTTTTQQRKALAGVAGA